ncbi:MAG: HAD hydrolase-like protein [Spirochaetes bacterium]|nr:HAD hydrolase-like protein [Spirochaetota bacterium]
MPFSTILFDLDGTLADSLPDIHHSVDNALAEFGLPPVDRSVAQIGVGNGVMNLLTTAVRASFKSAGRTDDADAWFRDNSGKLADRYRQLYASAWKTSTVLYPGVTAMLADMSAREVHCFVVSNKPEMFCRDILSFLGVAERFTAIIGEDSCAERKPSRIIWKYLSEKYSLQAESTIVVGDGQADFAFAKNIPCSVCLVRYGITPPETLEALHADHYIDAVSELKKIIAR